MADTATPQKVRIVRVLSCAYFENTTTPDGSATRLVRVARRGEAIPTENVADAEIQRLERLEAILPEGASAADADEEVRARVDYYRGQRGDMDALQRAMRRAATSQSLVDETSGIVDLTTGASTPASGGVAPANPGHLADHITANKLTVDDTVALAENDPERARRVLEAEHLASAGSPRQGVVQGLEKITTPGA